MLRCTICCRCLGLEAGPGAKIYDLLPVSWPRSENSKLRCTICCRCFGGLNAKIYDLLPVSWARSGVRMLG